MFIPDGVTGRSVFSPDGVTATATKNTATDASYTTSSIIPATISSAAC